MTTRDAYLHSLSAGGCGFTTVIHEPARAKFLASLALPEAERPKTAVCIHCWREVPVGELKWADGERVGA